MNRRQFLSLSGKGLAGLALLSYASPLQACLRKRDSSYSIVILGDTHYDTEPADVYHSHYNEKVEWLNRVQRAEFARNGEMWRERCPRLLDRASRLVTPDTRAVLQMGDLIQGDCGSGEVHRQMLDDVMNRFKTALGGLPFVTVAGNHDIRGTDAHATYHDYMPARMSRELDQKVTKTTFSFRIGRDVFIVIDFNSPDDEEVERLLDESADARYTFIVTHGPVFPMDSASARWFYHGGASEQETERRRHFRRRLAERNAIVLCGHTHTTELYDWVGDGGQLTQMTMNSVWSDESLGTWHADADQPDQYGTLRLGQKLDNGKAANDESALFDEYRPGLQRWVHSYSAGCYKLTVTPHHLILDMYAGDSETLSRQFVLR